MKKLILLSVFIFFTQQTFALEIDNVVISPINNSSINVLVATSNGNLFDYNTYTSDITNNVLTLNICYLVSALTTLGSDERNFTVPINNINVANYSIIVNVFFNNFQTSLCDFTNFQDTSSLNFSTPLTNSVALNTNQLTKLDYSLSPNPTTEIVKVIFDSLQQKSTITLKNTLGKIVSINNYTFIESINYSIDGESGMYFLTIENEKGEKQTQKIIKK